LGLGVGLGIGLGVGRCIGGRRVGRLGRLDRCIIVGGRRVVGGRLVDDCYRRTGRGDSGVALGLGGGGLAAGVGLRCGERCFVLGGALRCSGDLRIALA